MDAQEGEIMETLVPQMIWELENLVGLHYNLMNEQEVVMLEKDEVPYNRIGNAINYLNELAERGKITEQFYLDLYQKLGRFSERFAFVIADATYREIMIMLPSKYNYMGLGEFNYNELINLIVLRKKITRETTSNHVVKIIKGALENKELMGLPLSLEVRVFNILYVLIEIISDYTTASFLAQYMKQQNQLEKGLI